MNSNAYDTACYTCKILFAKNLQSKETSRRLVSAEKTGGIFSFSYSHFEICPNLLKSVAQKSSVPQFSVLQPIFDALLTKNLLAVIRSLPFQ